MCMQLGDTIKANRESATTLEVYYPVIIVKKGNVDNLRVERCVFAFNYGHIKEAGEHSVNQASVSSWSCVANIILGSCL